MYFSELTGDVVRRQLGVGPEHVVDGVLAFGVFDKFAGAIVRDVATHAERQGHDLHLQFVKIKEYSHAVEIDVRLADGQARRLWLVPVMGTALMAYYIHAACLLGARAIVQAGSVGGLAHGMRPGDVVVPTAVVGNDNTSWYARHAGGSNHQVPDENLTAALTRRLSELGPQVRIWSGRSTTCEMLGAETAQDVTDWAAAGFIAVEMEAALVCAVGHGFGAPTAVGLYVADCLVDGHHLYHEHYTHSRDARRAARLLVAGAGLDVLVTAVT